MGVKVSVIVAVNNGGNKLRKSLDSIKNQSLRDIEVIMVDALSSDNTADIMKSYIADSRFRFYSLSQESVSEARNFGLGKAEGKYIAFGASNVIFTKNLLRELYCTAEDKNADLCVSPMASTDIYGKHEFSSASTLSKEKYAEKFDINLIWNPAVTNKLFRREKIFSSGILFRPYGKAREAAFSLPFAFKSNFIACISRESAIYINPVKSEGEAVFPIEQYLGAYEYIIAQAKEAFSEEIENALSEFDKKELKKQMVCYIDQLYHKEITVLLYSYYRHFWLLDDEAIGNYTDIILSLYKKLSESGKSQLTKKNKDIFYGDKLISSRKEMAENPKVTLCISRGNKQHSCTKESLEIQVNSIFGQTMPSFELFVDGALYDIFPDKWKNNENVTFIEAESTGEFKDLCLERSCTDYIMYQDGFARLNPKILMRHYTVLEGKARYGFSTSPLTFFDSENTDIYIFSDLFFKSETEKMRIHNQDRAYLLDLFFCNKLFSVEHLRGIHFTFSDNPVYDMYKLYKHSAFRKIFHRGAYLDIKEDKAIAYLRSEEKLLDVSERKIYRSYKEKYFLSVKVKGARDKIKEKLSYVRAKVYALGLYLLTAFFTKMKIQPRVFFFTGRTIGKPDENLNQVYKNCNEKKVLFAKERPYGFIDRVKLRYYIITSKVTVTDDYIYFLRKYKLKPEQRLIQIWYTGGAFKKMGIDGPSVLSVFEEYRTHSQYSDFCVSSEYVRQYYCHAFGLDMNVVKAIGTPRSDLVSDKELTEKNKEEICSKHPLLRNKKVYIYCPTVRIKEDTVVPYNPEIDWDKLNDDLYDDEVFIICRHPSMKEEYIKGRFYSRVKDYTFENTSELLAVSNVIITDYSSIVFNASIMDKPMVFYCPDYEEYKDGFYLDYKKELPGEIITDFGNGLTAVRRAEEMSSKEVLAQFREKQMGACDGKSTERILSLIKKYLK